MRYFRVLEAVVRAVLITLFKHTRTMAVDVVLGLQWGDEGKGKIVDFLAKEYDIVARFQGGPNAGHTLKFDGKKYVLHTVPSGIFRDDLINIIGNGVVIDPITLSKELDKLDDARVDYAERLLVSNKAHLILPTHVYLDAASEAAKGKNKIGSTLKGIGPTYMDKTGRNGLRVGDLLAADFKQRYETIKQKHLKLISLYPEIDFDLDAREAAWFDKLERLKALKIVDTLYYVHNALDQGKKILAEGAQGSMLDIDFGTFPFVTSSNTITAGVCTGLGVNPHQIGRVIGIMKAYCTRVGSGPFPTELHDENGQHLRDVGQEYGATTGRPRRCGWLDLVQVKYAMMVNGVTEMAMTKIDCLGDFDEIQVAHSYNTLGQSTRELPFELSDESLAPEYTAYPGWKMDLSGIDSLDDLPAAAQEYIAMLESALDVPFTYVSTGPERKSLITTNTAYST